MGLPQGTRDRSAQAHFVKGLVNKIHGASGQAIVHGDCVALGGEHHYGKGAAAEFIQEVTAIPIRETQIQEDPLHRLVGKKGAGFLERGDGENLHVDGLKGELHQGHHGWVIFY
jgi:hypothetical protein